MLSVSASAICSEIRRARWVGHTRCDVIEGRINLIEAARAFNLADDDTVYRSVGAEEACALAIHLLHTGLAHPGEIMSVERATELWREFIGLFAGQDVQLLTNTLHSTRWTPATDATFDMGLLVIAPNKVGCLWIEEED
jgi:hypothetical protein